MAALNITIKFRKLLQNTLDFLGVKRKNSILVRYDIFFNLANQNSTPAWEERFKDSAYLNAYLEQGRMFYTHAQNSFPKEVDELLKRGARVADFGCGIGYGLTVLAKNYPNSKWVGLDHSSSGIDYANKNYVMENLSFEVSTKAIKDFNHYDIIFSSNTMEHFKNPWEIMKEMSLVADKYIIALVPFRAGLSAEHFYSFTNRNIKKSFGDFYLCANIIKDISSYSDKVWLGTQALLVYAKRS